MNKLLTTALCVVIFSLGLVSTVNATLESRLGGLVVYDTDLNITWLANARAAAGSGFDDGFSTTDGRLTWDNANAWIASLSIDNVIGWRLPEVNEMEHLFHVEGISAFSQGPFTLGPMPPNPHDSSWQWWSRTEFDPDTVYDFDFFGGVTGLAFTHLFSNNGDAWAVHDGDVTAIPEPETYAMLLAGLGLLGFMTRRRKESAV